MGSVRNLCTKGLLLDSGSIAHAGDIGSVIHQYLDAGFESKGEIAWESSDNAPGDRRGYLRAIRILSTNKVTSEVFIDEDINIEVDYYNLEDGSKRFLSLELYDMDGNYLFNSCSTPSMSIVPDPLYNHSWPIGLFRTKCTIPAFLLNDKKYTISLSVYVNHLPNVSGADQILYAENVLSFEVLETGAMRKETGSGKWDGIIRPQLGWHTVQLS